MDIPYFTQLTLFDAASATGVGKPFDVKEVNTVSLQITGAFVAIVTLQCTQNDADWVSLQMVNVADNASAATASAPGIFKADVKALSQIRASVAWTSGTSITITAYGSV